MDLFCPWNRLYLDPRAMGYLEARVHAVLEEFCSSFYGNITALPGISYLGISYPIFVPLELKK